MCIIIAKKKNCKVPSIRTFENAMNRNRDGFAITLKNTLTKKWVTKKTTNRSDMLNFLTECKIWKHPETMFVFHARLATHGKVCVENCHCWEDWNSGIVFAHNGVLPISVPEGGTDSEYYFRKVFMPIYYQKGWKAALETLEMFSTQRFALVQKKRNAFPITIIGNYIERDGVFYSNESAFEPKYEKQYFSPWLGTDVDDKWSPTKSTWVEPSWGSQTSETSAESNAAYWVNKATSFGQKHNQG